MCSLCEAKDKLINTFDAARDGSGLDREEEQEVVALLDRANRAQLTLIVSTLLVGKRVSREEVNQLTESLGLAVGLGFLFSLGRG